MEPTKQELVEDVDDTAALSLHDGGESFCVVEGDTVVDRTTDVVEATRIMVKVERRRWRFLIGIVWDEHDNDIIVFISL